MDTIYDDDGYELPVYEVYTESGNPSRFTMRHATYDRDEAYAFARSVDHWSRPVWVAFDGAWTHVRAER